MLVNQYKVVDIIGSVSVQCVSVCGCMCIHANTCMCLRVGCKKKFTLKCVPL